MDLSEIEVVPVAADEEPRFRSLMDARHYLGAAPKIGETIWYAARCGDDWAAALSFSAAVLKRRARDDWIGWDLRHKYDRLHLVANNTRFLILRPVPNLGSRVLSLWAAATLCGASGPTETHLWAKRLPQRVLRRRFRCRMADGRVGCPSITCFRLTLLAVPRREREAALGRWRRNHGWNASSEHAAQGRPPWHEAPPKGS